MAMHEHATMPLFGDRRDWARELLVATGAGVFLGLVGPFGSYLNGPLSVRLGYWIAALWIGTCLFGVILRPAIRGARRFRLPLPAALAMATVLASAPIALLCHAAASALWPGAIGGIGLLTFYGQTLVISAPIALGYGLLGTRRPHPRLPPEEIAPPPPAMATRPPPAADDFLSRLPAGLGRELVALQMEDHYVRAHTSKGSALVLIPLHQAIRELDGTPGLRVHRSWWVARDAVTGCIRDGRNVRLRLLNDVQAPVARASVAQVRAAGLLGAPEQGRTGV